MSNYFPKIEVRITNFSHTVSKDLLKTADITSTSRSEGFDKTIHTSNGRGLHDVVSKRGCDQSNYTSGVLTRSKLIQVTQCGLERQCVSVHRHITVRNPKITNLHCVGIYSPVSFPVSVFKTTSNVLVSVPNVEERQGLKTNSNG